MVMIPIMPVSSPIMAMIESVDILGKNRYFWSELANPFPIMPPEARAIIIWLL